MAANHETDDGKDEMTTLELNGPGDDMLTEAQRMALAEMAAQDDDDEVLRELEALEHRMHNPCEVVTNLAQTLGRGPVERSEESNEPGRVRAVAGAVLGGVVNATSALRSAFQNVIGEDIKSRDYSDLEVTSVEVRKYSSSNTARRQPCYVLRTQGRYAGCGLELTIGGGSLLRRQSDFEWLRYYLLQEYPGCVVPALLLTPGAHWSNRFVHGGAIPISSVSTSAAAAGAAHRLTPNDAEALTRFVSQVLEHPELSRAEIIGAFCAAEASGFELARSEADAKEKPPLVVRIGAAVLDVVGDASVVDIPDEDISARHREADVRELYAWAKDQMVAMAKCERECADGVAALMAFEKSTNAARQELGRRFDDQDSDDDSILSKNKIAADTPASGPTKALTALRELVGLAKALCEAIEGRERIRLQLVAATNALALCKASEAARRTMLDAARAQHKAEKLLLTKAPTTTPTPSSIENQRSSPELFGHALPPGNAELDAPIIADPPVVIDKPVEMTDDAKLEDNDPIQHQEENKTIQVAANDEANTHIVDSRDTAWEALSARLRFALEQARETSRDDVALASRRYLTAANELTVRASHKLGDAWTVTRGQLENAVAAAERRVDRQKIVDGAKYSAVALGAMGLRVVSKVALGAAAASASTDDVARAQTLVQTLTERFQVADNRLRLDAPNLKRKWDDLQYAAFESFAIGEQTRADVTRSAADTVALKLAAARTRVVATGDS